MEVKLLEGERIDDLERGGLKIIQNKKNFCFGIDAVLLSGFLRVNKNERVMDLGTGTGILPLLIKAKTEAGEIVGLEIQDISFDMASRSILMNDLQNQIKIVQGDLKQASDDFGKATFDVVTCNPPYMKAETGIVNPSSVKAVARHEIFCTFEDVAREAAALLKTGGRFYLVHRPNRLVDLFEKMRMYKLEPKRMKLVHSYEESEATLVLIEAVRDGGEQLIIEKPLIIYEEPGKYKQEIYDIYGY